MDRIQFNSALVWQLCPEHVRNTNYWFVKTNILASVQTAVESLLVTCMLEDMNDEYVILGPTPPSRSQCLLMVPRSGSNTLVWASCSNVYPGLCQTQEEPNSKCLGS